MKQLFTTLISLLLVSACGAQQVAFEVGDGIDDGTLKTAIERNTTALLNEINRAQRAGAPLNLQSVAMTPEARESISMLWANIPFRCEEPEIVERVMHTSGGFQVRNIPLSLTPTDTNTTDDTYQEAVVDFNSSGTITSFYFAISNNLYMQVMRAGNDVTDLRRRQLILDYVEHFRTAYNQKDIDFLWQVFSDDAIIITGKVIRTKPTDFNPLPQDKVIYNTQNKTQYLTRLKRVFDNSRYIRVNFSEIKVSKHPTRADYYGVLLRQGYDSGSYSDDGYVFLLWDFRDEEHPQIHVRTWQPYFVDQAHTKAIERKEIFDIGMFDI